MRETGQEVILRLTTVPAGYTGGNAFRHWSHVINQLWKQQISLALQSVIIQWCLTLEASTSGLAFASTKTESNDRLRDEHYRNLLTNQTLLQNNATRGSAFWTHARVWFRSILHILNGCQRWASFALNESCVSSFEWRYEFIARQKLDNSSLQLIL